MNALKKTVENILSEAQLGTPYPRSRTENGASFPAPLPLFPVCPNEAQDEQQHEHVGINMDRKHRNLDVGPWPRALFDPWCAPMLFQEKDRREQPLLFLFVCPVFLSASGAAAYSCCFLLRASAAACLCVCLCFFLGSETVVPNAGENMDDRPVMQAQRPVVYFRDIVMAYPLGYRRCGVCVSGAHRLRGSREAVARPEAHAAEGVMLIREHPVRPRCQYGMVPDRVFTAYLKST
jgi:hypothetical protein